MEGAWHWEWERERRKASSWVRPWWEGDSSACRWLGGTQLLGGTRLGGTCLGEHPRLGVLLRR